MNNQSKSICLLALVGTMAGCAAGAQGVIWSGPMISFTDPSGSDWRQASNQDRITDDVWLTRAMTRGIFNAAPGMETSYQSGISPAGTRWALGQSSDYASLTYTDWASCFGGNGNLSSHIVGSDAVVHLLNSDIYLAIVFTSWGGSSGGFSYNRSTQLAVPEPPGAALTLAGLLLLGLFRKKVSAASPGDHHRT